MHRIALLGGTHYLAVGEILPSKNQDISWGTITGASVLTFIISMLIIL